MASDEHLAILNQGVEAWNNWRALNPGVRPDLSMIALDNAKLMGADLRGAILQNAMLINADFSMADLRGAFLTLAFLGQSDFGQANLSGADLRGANLMLAHFGKAILVDAKLFRADLSGAALSQANLSRADLREATLVQALLVGTDLTHADLTGCNIHGISAWKLKLNKHTKQHNLIITGSDEPEITVDNIEVAQFIYLMLNNQKVREVIDTITSKVVLILGRFTDERKAVLDALRDELRKRNYLPILFDFDKPAGRDITETVSLLARMARFVVADITDAKSIPQELSIIVPDLPSVPVQPLLLEGSHEYSMFEHFTRYPWVLKPYRYESQEQLIGNLADRVIGPAEAKVVELRRPPPG